MQKEKVLVDIVVVKKEVVDWIYVQNFVAKRDLDDDYARLKRGMKGKT
jgi:hypothetical protein